MVDAAERWLPAPSFPDYEVSSLGRVKRVTTRTSTKAGRILKASLHHDGYLIHGLMRDKRLITVLLNRLVCAAFHGPAPSPRHQAAHDDGDELNNHEGNLLWKTPRENCADRVRHGTAPRGEKVRGILTEAAVRDIKTSRAQGVPYKVLVERHRVTAGMIGHIMNGRAWTHVV